MPRPKILHEDRVITFRCNGDTYAHVEQMAIVTGESVSEVVRCTLDKYLDKVVYILGRKDD